MFPPSPLFTIYSLLQGAVEDEDYDEAKSFKLKIIDLRKEVEELISGQEVASLVASVLPTPEWEGESSPTLTNGDDSKPNLSIDDDGIILPINDAPATISPPGDEVGGVDEPNRNNKSHVDYESRVSIYICVKMMWFGLS